MGRAERLPETAIPGRLTKVAISSVFSSRPSVCRSSLHVALETHSHRLASLSTNGTSSAYKARRVGVFKLKVEARCRQASRGSMLVVGKGRGGLGGR